MVNVQIDITEQPIEVDVNIVPTINQVVIEIDENGGGGGGAEAATQMEVDAGVVTNKYVSPATFENASKWTSKFNQPSGTTSEYIRGDGSIQAFPAIPPTINAATQIEVDAGTITDEFVSPKTFTDASKWGTKEDSIIPGTTGQYWRGDKTWQNFPVMGIPGGTASGTNTYAVTIAGVTGYNVNDAYVLKFTNANTGASTLNINGLGAINIAKNNVVPIIGGDIAAGQQFIAIYDGTNFQLIGVAPNQMFAFVSNADSVTITKGQVVYAFGAQGDRMSVQLANNSGDATSAKTIGLVFSSSIAPNGTGFIITQGVIDGLNLGAFNPGDTLYLSNTNGQYTATKPYAPNHLVYVGIVERANAGNGQIYVRVQNGYEMDELHDVAAQNPNPNDGLFYNSSTGLWTARAGTKSDVGLGNVDNTSDANKPISSATQTALDLKQNIIVVGKDVALSAGVTGATLTLVKSILIPANTFVANNVAFIKGLVTKTGTTNNVTLTAWVHTAASSGGIQIITAGTTTGSHRSFMLERDLDILVANGTGNGTRHASATTSVITDTTALGAAFSTSGIDWTTDKYINFFLQQTGAGADTSFLSGCYVIRY